MFLTYVYYVSIFNKVGVTLLIIINLYSGVTLYRHSIQCSNYHIHRENSAFTFENCITFSLYISMSEYKDLSVNVDVTCESEQCIR